jgi:hypothetical protein
MLHSFFIKCFVFILIFILKIVIFLLKLYKNNLEFLVKKMNKHNYFNEYVGYTTTLPYFVDFYNFLKKYKNYF